MCVFEAHKYEGILYLGNIKESIIWKSKWCRGEGKATEKSHHGETEEEFRLNQVRIKDVTRGTNSSFRGDLH